MVESSSLEKYFLHAILYSKDRPYQVQQLLHSIDRFMFTGNKCMLEGHKLIQVAHNVFCKISVYYTYSDPKFGELYDQLSQKEFEHYTFVKESKTNTVEEVTKLISETRLEGHINYFQFLVDDMLLFREVNIPEIL